MTKMDIIDKCSGVKDFTKALHFLLGEAEVMKYGSQEHVSILVACDALVSQIDTMVSEFNAFISESNIEG